MNELEMLNGTPIIVLRTKKGKYEVLRSEQLETKESRMQLLEGEKIDLG